MAAGDITWFSQAKVDLGLKLHNLDTDAIKLGLITAVATPAEADAAPHWGGTGTTNFATNEVTPGGNYTTGGPDISSTYAADGANAKFDATDVAIAQHVSNPANARWGIGYNSTDANKRALFFLDLGAAKDLTSGAFSITWNASGIATVS